MAKHLGRRYFAQDTVAVARDLLGRTLVYKNRHGRITETEAYVGLDDPASHSFRGPTPRTQIMFGKAGFSYVYFIYGMYFCLNIVTEKEGVGTAVLIRGVLDHSGAHLNGPGKLCRDWGITKADNAIDMTLSDELYVLDTPHWPSHDVTPRIGIKVAVDRPWRFVVKRDVLNS